MTERTADEINAIIAAWHAAPPGEPLPEHLGWTWRPGSAWWVQTGQQPRQSVDTNRSMIPMSGDALWHICGGCPVEIEPYESYWRGLWTGVLWCDSCYVADCDDE